jgi:hypothetical protein
MMTALLRMSTGWMGRHHIVSSALSRKVVAVLAKERLVLQIGAFYLSYH